MSLCGAGNVFRFARKKRRPFSFGGAGGVFVFKGRSFESSSGKEGGACNLFTGLSILRRRRERRTGFEFSAGRLSRNFLPGSSQQDAACRGGGRASLRFFLLRDDQAKKREHRSWLPSCAGRYHGAESSGMERYAEGLFLPCSAPLGARLLSAGYLQKGENAWLLALVCA